MEAAENLHDEAEENNESKISSVALPSTVAEFMEQKKTKSLQTLNDHVERLHLSLYEDPAYMRLLEAVDSSDTVEGSIIADDLEAARMIRERAAATGDMVVIKKKLVSISKALCVVLRRYEMSRKERRERVAGASQA